MTRAPFFAIAIFLFAGFVTDASRGEESRNLFFGEALFYAHQGEWFDALERLDTEVRQHRRLDEPGRQALWYQMADAEFSLGDFELRYRMHLRAGRAMQTVLERSGDEQIRNDAAYRLARIHFQKGLEHDALRVLDRISGKVPASIRDDLAFLRANVYLGLKWPEPAIPVLEKLLRSREYGAFAAYNLGIAYLQSDLKTAAYARLDQAGQIKGDDAATSAIRDKANLVLATRLLKENQYDDALLYLKRVRLDGPFSNQALLSAGWANMSAGKPDRALVPWSILIKRDATDQATQKAMLALPYAYGTLGNHGQATVHYGRALDAYGVQIEKLNRSIDSIRAGKFLQALTREEIREDKDWVIRLRSLPDTPETYYLMELLASRDFQAGLQDYLDLVDLQRRLSSWVASFDAHDELVALRRSHYEPLLPVVDEQFRNLDSRLRLQIEQHKNLLRRRDEMLTGPVPEFLAPTAEQADYHRRLTEFDRNLRTLDEAIAVAQEQHDRYVRARQAAMDSYVGYDKPMKELRGRARESIDKIDRLMARRGRVLEMLAIDELAARRDRLEGYRDKARYGLADSFDRAMQAPTKVIEQ